MTQSRNQAVYLPFIDGLRGIAILLVLAEHVFLYQLDGLHESTRWVLPQFEGWFLAAGPRGVQLFFLISAFTLFATSLRREGTEKFPRLGFYLRRAFRILPAWWVSIFIYAFVAGDLNWDRLVINLSMVFGFVRYNAVEYFLPQWSIFVEETFYVFFPFLFLAFRSARKTVVFCLTTYLVAYLWIRGAKPLGVPTTNEYISGFPLNHWYCFGTGILLYHVLSNPTVHQNLLRDKQWMKVLRVGAGIVFVDFFTKSHNLGILAAVALFFFGFSYSGKKNSVFHSALLRRFGVCCYSIYLFHTLFQDALRPVVQKLFTALPGLPLEARFAIWFPCFALINLVVGMVCFRILERPSIEFGKRLIAALESPLKLSRFSRSESI